MANQHRTETTGGLPHNQPSAPRTQDVWADGAAYERYIGRWSRVVARDFVAWIGVALGGRWLDVGCGTGALSQTILETAEPEFVQGIDRSADYVAVARQQVPDPRAQFATGDAGALALEPAHYDAVVSGLLLNFLPDPGQAVRDIARTAKAGGVVAAYVWDYAGAMQLLRCFWDVAAALNPAALPLDEGRRFPLCQPEPLAKLFRSAGLQMVEVRAIDCATKFHDFADYWSPFLGGQGPAPSYVASLGEEQRVALREALRQHLPVAPDGSISLVARAWAVRSVRAG